MTIEFSKMNSNGNDFLITENPNIFSVDIKQISDRNNGIGFDQILLVDPTPSKFKVKILNSDGSLAQTCFNGLRCIAGLYDLKNQISSRNNGIGFDQILLVDPTPSKFKVKILNPDGSSAQTCFNGLR